MDIPENRNVFAWPVDIPGKERPPDEKFSNDAVLLVDKVLDLTSDNKLVVGRFVLNSDVLGWEVGNSIDDDVVALVEPNNDGVEVIELLIENKLELVVNSEVDDVWLTL